MFSFRKDEGTLEELYEMTDIPSIMAKIKERLGQHRDFKYVKQLEPYDLKVLADVVTEANHTWDIRPLPPINSTRFLVGPLFRFAKRVVRKSIFWFVYPFMERQTLFNSAMTRAINELNRFVHHVEAELSAIGARLDGRGSNAGTNELITQMECSPELDQQVGAPQAELKACHADLVNLVKQNQLHKELLESLQRVAIALESVATALSATYIASTKPVEEEMGVPGKEKR